MTQLARLCAAALIAILPACSAQTASHPKRSEPKPEPTAPELFEFIRGSLLTLSPDDGINDNIEVTFNWTSNVMTITQPTGHCDLFLNALNTTNVVWDVFDPSDAHQTRDKLVRVTLVSVSGTKARTCYDKMNNVDSSVPPNRVRLLFSFTKADGVPGFQDKMTKALKKLIVLSGGAPESKLF
jgi:hypothetical protein